MKRTKTQRGITLVALIITIVILLILAAVAVATIQNDGILSRANEAATQYNQKVGEEGVALGNLYDSLNPYFPGSGEGEDPDPETPGSGEGGETPDPEGGTTTTYTAYTIGDEVKVVKDGVEHVFYVIENSDATQAKVLLLTENQIDPEGLVQSRGGKLVKFSTEKYWTVGEGEEIPEETIPIPDSHIAAKAAYDYGAQFEGNPGRLMTEAEATILSQNEEFSEKLYWADTWLSTYKGENEGGYSDEVSGEWVPRTEYHVSLVQHYGWISQFHYEDEEHGGVRPVVEISKTLLSQT